MANSKIYTRSAFARTVSRNDAHTLYASMFLLDPSRLTLTHPVPATPISCRHSHHPTIRELLTSLPAHIVEKSMCCSARRDTETITARSVADSFHCPFVDYVREIRQSSHGCFERFYVSPASSFCLQFNRDTYGYSYSVK